MGINIEIDRELIEGFVDDATEALCAFETATVALLSGQTSETLEELFCVAHNLKGASMCIGMERFGDFMHRVEDVIQFMINGGVPESERVVSVLLAAHRCMMNWVGALLTNVAFVPDTESLLKDLDSLARQSELPASPSSHVGEDTEDDTDDDEEELQAVFQMHRKIYEDALRATEELERDGSNDESDSLRSLIHSPHSASRLSSKKENSAQRSQETIRISAHKLDELVQLLSELSIHQAIIKEERRGDERPTKAAARALQLSYALVKEIHAKALELRMQPLTGLLRKLERNALDLAMTQGKRVKVVLEGSDVQFDKTVLEKMSDPLVHVIRNAVDHGIELPSERESAGKPTEATLKISATQDVDSVSIVVSDDGRGMDDNAIFAAAVRKGIIHPTAQLTPDQIKKLIFIQGVSTAPKLTEISGRGVGMDIVMRTIQSLKGRINIWSALGKGTRFRITLPTSLSVIDALVVRVDDARYVVPMNELTEIIDLSRHPIERAGSGGFIISLRGEVIPVEALSDYMPTLNVRDVRGKCLVAGANNRCPALLVRDSGQSVAFTIDRVVSRQQVVVRPLSDNLDGLQGLRGCAILGDGEPGVILSLPELARIYFSSVGGE